MSLKTPVAIHSKLPDVGTTIFSVIGQLSAQHQAINLSQGAPNFPVIRRWSTQSAARCRKDIISMPP